MRYKAAVLLALFALSITAHSATNLLVANSSIALNCRGFEV
jgi:hypothetical protein